MDVTTNTMNMMMETSSSLIEYAIRCLQGGEVEKASMILDEIESRISYDAERYQASKTVELISAVRNRYGLRSDARQSQQVDDYDRSNQEGVSLVTCCMNREENLLKALPTWLSINKIDEVVIVDWSSEKEVSKTLLRAGIDDCRIRIVRAIDEPRWVCTFAYNLGFRHAKYNKILKVDADIILKADFFEKNSLPPGTFVAGNWEVAEKGQEHINGFFYLYKEDLHNIKGFNEFITTYGWDDDDIYSRLSNYGLQRVCVDTDSIYHIPHDDVQRLGGLDSEIDNALSELNSDPLYKIRVNRYLAMVMPPWKYERQYAPFDIVSKSENYTEVRRRKSEMPHIVIDEIMQDAEYYAALELVSWRVGPQVYHLNRKMFFELLRRKKLDEISADDIGDAFVGGKNDRPTDKYTNINQSAYISAQKSKFYVDAQHGLGNRLRAIASAAVIAEVMERELVIVWQPDDHCNCNFSDLFCYDGAVIAETFVSEARKQGMSVFNYMEIEGGDRGVNIVDVKSGKDIYARSAYVLKNEYSNWHLENAWLQKLRPVDVVNDHVNGVRIPNDLSVHIRMVIGDDKDRHLTYEVAGNNWTREEHEEITYWRKKSHYVNFMRRIDVLIGEGRAERIYLAADEGEVYREFLSRYGDRVAYLPRMVNDRSAEQLRYAIADALLLGSSPVFLGSTWSSFSELALRLSRKEMKVEMSGKDF